MAELSRFHELFLVEADLGLLILKKNYKTRKSGDIISSENQSGRYKQVYVDETPYKLHRVIWEMINGPIMEGIVIDHLNGDTKDNSIKNLRACSQSENLKNRKIHSNNKSGIKGVYYDPSGRAKNKWRAQIRVDGKKLTIGRFPTPADAKAAYDMASQKLHGEFSRQ